MKVFIDGIIFGQQFTGGISRVWEELLARLPAHGLELHLLVPFRKKNPSLVSILGKSNQYHVATDLFYWPQRIFGSVPVRSAVLQIYLKREIQVVHSTHLSVPIHAKARRVVTVHDLIPELYSHQASDRWAAKTLKRRQQVFEHADHLVAVSHNTRRDLLRLYPQIAPEKVSVIYNGPTTYEKGEIPSLEAINRTHGTHLHPGQYYLYVGKRAGYKNFRLLIELLRTHADEYKNALFVCIGGEDSGPLQLELKRLGLAKHVVFLPFVRDSELAALYQHAVALVYPSLYEGFGLPVLEAMMHDCLVVCGRVASLPEVGGEAARYFDPHSAHSLHEALQALPLVDHAAYCVQARQNVARFSWDDAAKQLADLYDTLS